MSVSRITFVGVDAYIDPAGCTDLTELFGEFVHPKAPLGHKGPIPPVRGKWPEGPKGVGTLAQRA